MKKGSRKTDQLTEKSHLRLAKTDERQRLDEKESAELALRNSENLYRNVYDTAPMAFVLWDKQCGITSWNKRAEEIFGWSQDEVLGRNFFDFLIPPTARIRVEDVVQGLLQGKIEQDVVNENLTKSGKTILCRWNNSILRDLESNVIGAMSLALDITEQKHSEEALRESEEKYRTVLEASPDPVVVYDMEGKVLYLNPAFTRVFGWTLAELSHKQTGYVPEENWPETRVMINKVLAGESFSGIESRRLTKGGHILDVSLSASVYRDHQRHPIGSVINIRDITENKKLEYKLQQAKKFEAMGTLAGGIAHEFNNLLMAIQWSIALVLKDIRATHPQYNILKKVEDRIEKGAKLTSRLLGYARRGKYQIRPLNLNELVEETSGTFMRTNNGIRIHQKLAAHLSCIAADSAQIEQVLLNLYINATEAMPGGGNLILKTKNVSHRDIESDVFVVEPGKYIQLTVTDTGIGMNKEILERIFDPFFTTKDIGNGAGLGLACVYGIIKNHNGYINVTSKAGRGSTFKIYFPVTQKKNEKPMASSEDGRGRKATVLFVDDEEMLLEAGVEVLKASGYTVFEARSGAEAIETYMENRDRIDLVILDIVMPDMSGGEVYDRLIQMNPSAKVLLSSGYSIEGQATDILERGCNGFIQKPFRTHELFSKIKEILHE